MVNFSQTFLTDYNVTETAKIDFFKKKITICNNSIYSIISLFINFIAYFLFNM